MEVDLADALRMDWSSRWRKKQTNEDNVDVGKPKMDERHYQWLDAVVVYVTVEMTQVPQRMNVVNFCIGLVMSNADVTDGSLNNEICSYNTTQGGDLTIFLRIITTWPATTDAT